MEMVVGSAALRLASIKKPWFPNETRLPLVRDQDSFPLCVYFVGGDPLYIQTMARSLFRLSFRPTPSVDVPTIRIR